MFPTFDFHIGECHFLYTRGTTGGFEGGAGDGDGGDRVGEKLYTGRNPQLMCISIVNSL